MGRRPAAILTIVVRARATSKLFDRALLETIWVGGRPRRHAIVGITLDIEALGNSGPRRSRTPPRHLIDPRDGLRPGVAVVSRRQCRMVARQLMMWRPGRG